MPDLAQQLCRCLVELTVNLMGYDMTPLMISRIEKKQRHVCDAELKVLAEALGVTMDWLCGAGDDLPRK